MHTLLGANQNYGYNQSSVVIPNVTFPTGGEEVFCFLRFRLDSGAVPSFSSGTWTAVHQDTSVSGCQAYIYRLTGGTPADGDFTISFSPTSGKIHAALVAGESGYIYTGTLVPSPSYSQVSPLTASMSMTAGNAALTACFGTAGAATATAPKTGWTELHSSINVGGDYTVLEIQGILTDDTTTEVTFTGTPPYATMFGVELEPGATNTQPNQPTVSVTDVRARSVDLAMSAFSDPDGGDTHAGSRWQIDVAAGDFSSPVWDSGDDASNLTSFSRAGSFVPLSPSTAYKARGAQKDDSGDAGTEWSAWSAAASFTTDPPGELVTVTLHDIQ